MVLQTLLRHKKQCLSASPPDHSIQINWFTQTRTSPSQALLLCYSASLTGQSPLLAEKKGCSEHIGYRSCHKSSAHSQTQLCSNFGSTFIFECEASSLSSQSHAGQVQSSTALDSADAHVACGTVGERDQGNDDRTHFKLKEKLSDVAEARADRITEGTRLLFSIHCYTVKRVCRIELLRRILEHPSLRQIS